MFVNISELIGKTIIDIKGMEKDSEIINFVCSDGSRYMMYHDQDCCESVSLEDVYGLVNNLLDSTIVMSEEVTNENQPAPLQPDHDSYTWTFYKFATAKGYVTLRWYGYSNGYYGEGVSFSKEDNVDIKEYKKQLCEVDLI